MAIWKDPKRKVWVSKFQYQKRQYKKEGFQTRSEALAWEARKRDELKNPPPEEPIRLTFSQVSTMYLEDCQARFQKNTWRQKAFVYRNFLTFINDDPVAESITKQTFIEYLKFRKEQKDKFDRREKKRLRTVFAWLTETLKSLKRFITGASGKSCFQRIPATI